MATAAMIAFQVVGSIMSAKAQMQQAQMQAQQIAFKAASDSANLQMQANAQVQESQRMEMEQREFDMARRDELIASSQEETQRRRELRETLSTIDSIRAARGLTVSPTARAFTSDIRQSASADIRTNKLNRMQRADSLRMRSQYAGSLAAYSMDTSRFYKDQAGMVRENAQKSMRSVLKAGSNAAKMSLLQAGTSVAGSSTLAKSIGGPTSTTLSSGETIKWSTNRYGMSY